MKNSNNSEKDEQRDLHKQTDKICEFLMAAIHYTVYTKCNDIEIHNIT